MRTVISDDSYAIILLCSDLSTKKTELFHTPLTVSEWGNVAESLIANKLTPKSFFTDDVDNLLETLKLDDTISKRIKSLMKRAALISLEINSLHEKGIFILTRADSEYPSKYKTKLGRLCPPVLFCAGNIDLLKKPGVVIVGSRNLTSKREEFTKKIAEKCVNDNLIIISGGAKGADSISENVAIQNNGSYISIISDNLIKKIQQKEVRESIMKNKALIISPFSPTAHFSVANAMQRNKYVYSLGEVAIVISSTDNKGGSWAGAIENHKKKFTPMCVYLRSDEVDGNDSLAGKFAIKSINDDQVNEKLNLLDLKNNYIDAEIKLINSDTEPKKSSKVKVKKKVKKFDHDDPQLALKLNTDDD
jgi:DNA processing protein